MSAIEALVIKALAPAAVAVAIAGAALGAVLGALLLFDSARVLRWNASLSRWVSTRALSEQFDRPREIKRWIYRGHRVIGLLIFAGSLYTLDALNFDFNSAALARAFRDLGGQGPLAVAFESLRVFLFLGNLAALGAGALLCFRPGVLHSLEAWADRSFGPRGGGADLDAMRYEPDLWVSGHPRTAGVLLLLASSYVLFNLAIRPLL